jgi:YVTN family beta-propeller protein
MTNKMVACTWLVVLVIVLMLGLTVTLPSASAQDAGRANLRKSGNTDNPNGNYNPTYNPGQIALKRWYQANTAPTVFQVPATSSNTYGIAFDGTDIWVSSGNYGRLNRLSTNGQLLATVDLGGGSSTGLAYDGSNIWVANGGLGKLQKVSTVPPYTVTTISVSGMGHPWSIEFDGSHVWVTDRGSNAVFAVGVASPYPSAQFPVGNDPVGIAFDGDCMWVTNAGDKTVWSVPDPYGFHCQVNGGVAGPVWQSTGQVWDIAYDGINIWVSVRNRHQVVELDDAIQPGAVLQTVPLSVQPFCLAFDGAYIWVGSVGIPQGGTAIKLTASNNPNSAAGTVVGTYALKGGTYNSPNRFAFDGANIWVTLSGVDVGKM